MTIKHLVIPGGGPTGIRDIGILQQLEKNGYLRMADIETIYATSAGALIALLIALKFDWESINDYIVLRPWHEVYKVTASNIFDAYSKKGIFDNTMFEIFYKPFFDSKDLPLTISMKEFYEYSKIELHFFTLELNKFEITDVSYKTFPDIPVIQAVHMSCAIPTLICPVCFDNKFFIDGGVVTNYPIKYCLEQHKNVDEIFGINNVYNNLVNNIVNNESTILEFAMHFVSKLVIHANETDKNVGLIPNELSCNTPEISFSYMKEIMFSSEKRRELLEDGKKNASFHFSNSTFQKC